MNCNRVHRCIRSAWGSALSAVSLLLCGIIVFGAPFGARQNATPQSEQGTVEKKSQHPVAPETKRKKTPPGSEKQGQGLKFSETPAFREAPLTGGEGGGYSSSMGASVSLPQGGTNVEEKAMEELLLNSPRWRVGPRGLIEREEDGGEWRAVASGVTSDLLAVSFSNRWIGWAVGAAGTVLRTEDGGRSWRRFSFPSRSDLVAVRSDDWKSAQVATRAGTVYVTADAGASWSVVHHR